MAKVVVNIKNSDLGSFKDSDLLVFDKDNNIFYKTTYEEFWVKHEEELRNIIKRYDEVVEELKTKVEENDKKYNELVDNLNKQLEAYLTQTNKSNKALIEMVKNFINAGGK